MQPTTDAVKYAATHRETTLLPNGKIRFDQTGMEFPSTASFTVLDAYANGKAFRRAVAKRANEAYDFSVHEPYIVPHKDRDEHHFLYCSLTKATLPRDREIVQTHISAKRFRRRLAELEEAKRKQEELSEKRRHKREKAHASRKMKAAELKDDTERDCLDELEDPMDEDKDILEGIISDDDDGIDGENDDKDALEPMRSREIDKMKKNPGGQSENAMEEDGAKESEVFWTRSRKGAAATEDDEHDDDEWAEPQVKEKLRQKSEKRKALPAKSISGVDSDDLSDVEKEAKVSGKRNRVKVQVPRKVRHARRRRRFAQQASA